MHMNTNNYSARLAGGTILTLLLFFHAPTANAQITAGKILGTAKTIYNALIGSVTVTPAYALHTWRQDYSVQYGQCGYSEFKRVTRDPSTQVFLFHYFGVDCTGSGGESTDPFYVGYPSRLNYYCDLSSPPNYFTWVDTIDFRVAVWADSIQKTGFWPPSPPFETWLKTTAHELSSTCFGPAYGGQEVRKQVDLPENGIVVVAMPLVNYQYAWPMQCWVGGPYDY
jgi:hypothetical protein